MPREKPVVAIDGPAGSGKTTVARLVARALGYLLVDTGAWYRCLALQARRLGVGNADREQLGALAAELAVRLEEAEPRQRVWLGDEEVTDLIREPEISQAASRVSVHPEVRAALLHIQRELGRDGGVVLEGRDIGTVVFPDAEVKVFLDAPLPVRARRRFEEIGLTGREVDLGQTVREIARRDRRDEGRSLAPLKPAPDAAIIATEHLSVDEVVNRVLGLVENFLRRMAKKT